MTQARGRGYGGIWCALKRGWATLEEGWLEETYKGCSNLGT